METRIARFHNIYGPYGTWKGGREKAPAAFCRKAICATVRCLARCSAPGERRRSDRAAVHTLAHAGRGYGHVRCKLASEHACVCARVRVCQFACVRVLAGH